MKIHLGEFWQHSNIHTVFFKDSCPACGAAFTSVARRGSPTRCFVHFLFLHLSLSNDYSFISRKMSPALHCLETLKNWSLSILFSRGEPHFSHGLASLRRARQSNCARISSSFSRARPHCEAPLRTAWQCLMLAKQIGSRKIENQVGYARGRWMDGLTDRKSLSTSRI